MTMGYAEIEAEDLHHMLADGKVMLVDVRNNDEVVKGMLPGALHMALALLPVKFELLEGEAPLVFYCHSGIRSAQAAAFLVSKGRNNVFHLRGGTLAWGKAGFPFIRQLQTPPEI